MTATHRTGTIPARKGQAIRLDPGETLTLVNPAGTQVVDTWAFRQDDLSEYMSMPHTRSVNSRWRPTLGTRLVSTRRRLMLVLAADSTPGVHDTLLPACCREIYEELGVEGHHDSCEDNLEEALAAIGLAPPCVPQPLNLFMNVPLCTDGSLTREPPTSRPGDRVSLRATMKLIVVCSACPQDITPINGALRTPTSIDFEVRPAAA